MESPSTYIIATKHEQYVKEKFPEGSVVIDPWRYIPNQEGVTVKRLGENKPEMISLLCPTRGRPAEFKRMSDSAFDLATHDRQVELIAYHDEDDTSGYYGLKRVQWVFGPRILLSSTWNECYKHARGDILMHCGDDIIFRTPGWDSIVRKTFAEAPDPYICVHGDDCSPNTDALATHGFYHRKWVETLGYFMPPYFSSDWNDVWLTEVADEIGRRIKIPIITEHMHYAFGKAEHDQTYAERELRGIEDDVVKLFNETKKLRKADAKKLKAAIAA